MPARRGVSEPGWCTAARPGSPPRAGRAPPGAPRTTPPRRAAAPGRGRSRRGAPRRPRAPRRNRPAPAHRWRRTRAPGAQPLVRARLDERRDQQRVEQPLRLAPPHLLHQPAGVLVGKIGARRPPAPSQQRRHLHDVAGLLVRQPRQLRRPRRPGAGSAAPATARSRPPSARSAGDPTAAPADRPRWPRTSADACRNGECSAIDSRARKPIRPAPAARRWRRPACRATRRR